MLESKLECAKHMCSSYMHALTHCMAIATMSILNYFKRRNSVAAIVGAATEPGNKQNDDVTPTVSSCEGGSLC